MTNTTQGQRQTPVIKVFSATMQRDREVLGETASNWLKDHSNIVVDEIRTLQSSDAEFHCITIVLIGHLEAVA